MNEIQPRVARMSNCDLAFLAGLVGLAPMLYLQSMNLAQKPHFQFFPMAWGMFAWLVYSRGKPGEVRGRVRSIIGYSLWCIFLGLAALSVLKVSPWLAHLGLIFLIAGWTLQRLTGNAWYQPIGWLALIVITLPMPRNLDQRLVQSLQIGSSQSASALLDIVGTPHLATGNIIEIRTGRLFVDEACSGVDSLYALAAVALALVIWQSRSFLPSLLVLLTVPAWAWLGNLLRIFLIAVLLDRFQIDLTHGWQHSILGMATFALSSACLLLSQAAFTILFSKFDVKGVSSNNFHRFYDYVVSFPMHTREASRSKAKSDAKSIGTGSGRPVRSPFALNAIMGALSLCLFGFALLPVFGIGPWKRATIKLPAFSDETIARTFSSNTLPTDFHSMRQVDFGTTHRKIDSLDGEYSATWQYLDGDRQVVLSVDFPFSGFHGLEECYILSGGTLIAAIAEFNESGNKFQDANVRELRVSKPLSDESYVCYHAFDSQGVSMRSRAPLLSSDLSSGIRATYQVQIFIDGCGQLSESERERYRGILIEASETILPVLQSMKAD